MSYLNFKLKLIKCYKNNKKLIKKWQHYKVEKLYGMQT